MIINREEKEQLSAILNELGGTLDITKTEYERAVQSYRAVGAHLVKGDSELAPFKPEILPQGSFMLGTMVKPVSDDDDLDIDLVCQLKNKPANWTQIDLKKSVGNQLKKSTLYERMIKEPEGRRCWTLIYADDSGYHMDILPSIVDSNYRILLEKAFSLSELGDTSELAIRITDKEERDYNSETNHLEWLKSNPFGYAKWFFHCASIDMKKSVVLNELIKPMRKYQETKLPLQRAVQILKRHRDIMFDGDEDKPISIIITTLAAESYAKQTSVIDALIHIVDEMPNYIKVKYSEEHRKNIKWVENPVNSEENFADKWPENPVKEDNFFKWHNKLKEDLNLIFSKVGTGINEVQKAFSSSFGEKTINKVFENYGQSLTTKRDDGLVRMASESGLLGAVGTKVKKHNFEGNSG
jgi:hypothetical protein